MGGNLVTPWGYEIVGDLPSLIDASTFNRMTGDRFAGMDVSSALASVSAAIRGYCGWHIAPNVTCYFETNGPGRTITVPTLALTDLIEVTEHGQELDADELEWLQSGLIRKPPSLCWHHPGWHPKWRSVHVTYESGYDMDAVPDLAAIVSQVASNHLAAPAGVRSERAGNVEVSYNTTGNGVSGGVTLLSRDMSMLGQYRLPAILR